MNKKYVCPCGLTCCDCLFYKPETYDSARKLMKAIKDSQRDHFISGNVKNESWNVIARHLNKEESEISANSILLKALMVKPSKATSRSSMRKE